MKHKIVITITVIMFLLLVYKVYYHIAKYNHKWWFNYLDQSGLYENEIEKFDEESIKPNDIIEYELKNGSTVYIYSYDGWYDISSYYAEDGAKCYDYRVVTSDSYKLGPQKIQVGASRIKVNFLFSWTKHSHDPMEILYVNDEGVVELLKCRGYMNTSPVDNSKLGFVFSHGNVILMVYSPSDI